jgi:hypothetical protein
MKRPDCNLKLHNLSASTSNLHNSSIMAQLVPQEVENDDRRYQDHESILNIGDLERAASQKMPKIVRGKFGPEK